MNARKRTTKDESPPRHPAGTVQTSAPPAAPDPASDVVSPTTWSGAAALRPLLVPVGSLCEDPANVRIHPDRNLAAIEASLRRFGQQVPLVVDAAGVVRAGNGRLRAARALGWTHVAAIRSDLAPVDLVAYAIADNRTAELAEWDYTKLQATLGELSKLAQFATDGLATGFSSKDFAAMDGWGIEPPEARPYDEAKETVVVKIVDVPRAESQAVVGVVNRALEQAALAWRAEAY